MQINLKLQHKLNRLLSFVGQNSLLSKLVPKRALEAYFWQKELANYQTWFTGGVASYYQTPSPKNKPPVHSIHDPKYDPLLAWFHLHQAPKYLHDLCLPKTAFVNQTILDIGSGPIPSAAIFEKINLFCLDPLMDVYQKAGYPTHIYEGNIKFVNARAEKMPFADKSFDAVISVNALDHVEDLKRVSQEIKRVLKKGGKLAIHFHHHPVTFTEPISKTETEIAEIFSWCKNLKQVKKTNKKFGWQKTTKGEYYTVWHNF